MSTATYETRTQSGKHRTTTTVVRIIGDKVVDHNVGRFSNPEHAAFLARILNDAAAEGGTEEPDWWIAEQVGAEVEVQS